MNFGQLRVYASQTTDPQGALGCKPKFLPAKSNLASSLITQG